MLASVLTNVNASIDSSPRCDAKSEPKDVSYRQLYIRVRVTDTVPHLAHQNEMFLNSFEQDEQGKTRGTKSELLRNGKNEIVDVRCLA